MSLTTAPEPNVEYLKTDPDLPPVGVVDRTPISPTARFVFLVIGLVGGLAWYMIAIVRNEHISAVWFVLAAICTYLIAYRFYARLIERKIVKPRDDVATPAEIMENGADYMPTDRRVLFGHHFAAIAGAAHWSVRSWPRKWVICQALCGSSSESSLPVPYRISWFCGSRPNDAAAASVRWLVKNSASSAASRH